MTDNTDWKWKYENLCKFATDFENKYEVAKEKIAELQDKVDEARNGFDLIRNVMRRL